MGDEQVFGYGSLILPTSMVGRFADVGGLDSIYAEGVDADGDELLRDEALEVWEDVREDIDVVPVRVEGLERYYSLESRGGAMLEAVEADDEDAYINGVVVSGLTEDQHDAISATESSYEEMSISPGDIEVYEGIDADVDFDAMTIYVRDPESDDFDLEEPKQRQPVYHERIMQGIEMMDEEYDTDIADAFRAEFEETTYETSLPGGQMITVGEKDRSIENYQALFDGR